MGVQLMYSLMLYLPSLESAIFSTTQQINIMEVRSVHQNMLYSLSLEATLLLAIQHMVMVVHFLHPQMHQ